MGLTVANERSKINAKPARSPSALSPGRLSLLGDGSPSQTFSTASRPLADPPDAHPDAGGKGTALQERLRQRQSCPMHCG
jgi:hypothetical protein